MTRTLSNTPLLHYSTPEIATDGPEIVPDRLFDQVRRHVPDWAVHGECVHLMDLVPDRHPGSNGQELVNLCMEEMI